MQRALDHNGLQHQLQDFWWPTQQISQDLTRTSAKECLSGGTRSALAGEGPFLSRHSRTHGTVATFWVWLGGSEKIAEKCLFCLGLKKMLLIYPVLCVHLWQKHCKYQNSFKEGPETRVNAHVLLTCSKSADKHTMVLVHPNTTTPFSRSKGHDSDSEGWWYEVTLLHARIRRLQWVDSEPSQGDKEIDFCGKNAATNYITLHDFLWFLCSSLTSLHPDAFRAMQSLCWIPSAKFSPPPETRFAIPAPSCKLE